MRRLLCAFICFVVSLVARAQVPVVLVAGQSNTDGRVDNAELPEYIKRDGYRYCQWSFGSGVHSGDGRFAPFAPRNYSQKPERWAYDAVVYYELERLWQQPFYVIKESLGGTAIDPRCESNSNMHWSANPDYLATTAASDKGGLSLLKAFTENIGACIDNQLSKLPEGYDIKFMLWHQGESDRSQADSYHDNLKAVVDYVRTYLVNKTGQQKYARLPFICGTFSKASRQGSPKVAAAMYRLQQEDANFHVVDVSDATLGRDQIHFDAAGAELLGKRMFQKVQEILKKDVPVVKWDKYSLIIDGRRVCPVMGEVHYSRIPAAEWQQEVRKMKEGGVTVIACYVFWNHIEETEGMFDWSGQRDLRTFLEICQAEEMPVVLRVGPFCHGEARCGGIPDWMFAKGCKMRSQDPVFLKYTERLYRQIFTQVQGLQWKDGGPVMAMQFDNEYRGSGDYLMALKKMAIGIGFDLPFYTRTGWPELSKPVPFGEMIPLYGDYADGFWERSLEETAGNYYKAFNFKAFRSSTAIATEQLGEQKEKLNKGDEQYPYFTCELGGGMMTAYHRRPYLYPEDAYSMAVVKLGSGSNLLGYYMYHGGTNPDGKTWLNEMQRTPATNYNDMPVKNYDFQAPLGEFGQRNPHYYMLRKLHLFMHDWGGQLALMEAEFPCQQDIKKGDDSFLRWSVRSKDGSGFIFINNYERLQNLSAKRNVQLEACGVKLPRLTIPASTVCILPVNIDGIRYATAQLIARRDGKIYMEQIKGIPTTIALSDGKVLRNVKARGTEKPVYKNICLLTSEEAERLFLPQTGHEDIGLGAACEKVREAGPLRTITIGVNKVAEEPTDEDFAQAAVYRVKVPVEAVEKFPRLLSIDYQGDCARLYVGGRLVADHFNNGRPFLYGLWRLPKGCTELELRILPMQQDEPVYFPREADTMPGEKVKSISITYEGL